MLADVQAHFGFKRPLYGAGVFETDHQRTVVREVCSAVQTVSTAVRPSANRAE